MAVAIVDQNRDQAETAAAQIVKMGGSSIAIQTDVTQEAEVERMMGQFLRQYGRLDIAINNAGIGSNVASEEADYAGWAKVVEVNLTGVFLTAKAAGKQMISQRQGSIVNTASMSAHIVNRPQPQSAYNAAKAGVVMLTKSLAVEWAPHQVRVNCISPGYIETAMTSNAHGWKAEWLAQSVSARLGRPSDLVGAYLYLASDASPFTTGADLVVDGGFTVV